MILIPAIDLKDGKCVRLRQGNMDNSTIFSNDPLMVAKKWVELGAKRLHLIDLDGAFIGKPVNIGIINKIAKMFPYIKIQVGGGIRTIDNAKSYIDAGIHFLIIGTKIMANDNFVNNLCDSFPHQIILALDAKNGLMTTDGWTKKTNTPISKIAKNFERHAINSIIYTDIVRDGMMSGVNIDAVDNLAKITTIPIIASGGIANMDDIYALKNTNNKNIVGAITGQAIYEGSLDFAMANNILQSN